MVSIVVSVALAMGWNCERSEEKMMKKRKSIAEYAVRCRFGGTFRHAVPEAGRRITRRRGGRRGGGTHPAGSA